ncbi:glycosyltransferase N-terminal domain-containing protein [Sphingobacterium sp.]|uniref:3-deoxy-D-manno-octulosonic acid transferase n=1 Tax=Sphingobacterium sp. TaxID=341027 RepID=UPI0028AA3D15|nr:glycosyltransferase N-terminal domain-containing protein [Sphingobacterium sp.]
MMRFLYDLGILIYGLLLRIFALFNTKAKLLSDGRKGLMQHIEQSVEKGQEYIWFHFASLGEFEQGRSVMEQIKLRHPKEKIIVTFFSPSGYEIRKNTALADHVFYLPADTARNARRFLDIINPKLAIFTKYEYWYHYFRELDKRNIRLLMISAIFRENQVFFKQYGGFFRSILKNVSYFFTQNAESVNMLKWIGITKAGLAGDTRFDRVVELPKEHKEIPEAHIFAGNEDILVAGSTWPADEALIKTLLENNKDLKAIIAPHEIHQDHIDAMMKLFPHALLFSKFHTYTDQQIASSRQLIIDNIGMLSSLYHYGRIAYIGGGFGAGIHNTLEAATYGMPVIFGPKYEKFQEAVDLMEIGAGFSISNEQELLEVYNALCITEKLVQASIAAKNYVQQRSGATQIIMKYLETEKLLG